MSVLGPSNRGPLTWQLFLVGLRAGEHALFTRRGDVAESMQGVRLEIGTQQFAEQVGQPPRVEKSTADWRSAQVVDQHARTGQQAMR